MLIATSLSKTDHLENLQDDQDYDKEVDNEVNSESENLRHLHESPSGGWRIIRLLMMVKIIAEAQHSMLVTRKNNVMPCQ